VLRPRPLTGSALRGRRARGANRVTVQNSEHSAQRKCANLSFPPQRTAALLAQNGQGKGCSSLKSTSTDQSRTLPLRSPEMSESSATRRESRPGAAAFEKTNACPDAVFPFRV
jgi:hypothetical protein